MTSAIEKIDSTTVKLTVSLTEEELAPAMAHAVEHIGQSVTIPGFRKGKVPARILEQRIGKGAIVEHAVNEGVAGWYAAAIEEQDLRPYGQPEIEVTKVPGAPEGQEGLEFVATVEVRPEVTLPALDSLTVEVDPITVADEDVEQRLTALRERFGALTTVEKPAANGDFVTLDLTAVVDGDEVDAVQGTSYQVGTGNMIEGLDEAVTGLSAGESTTFEGPLAAGEHAGAKATISITVTAVKSRELPAADDDFAQLASEFDTLEELKADIREQVERIKVNNQGVEARAKLLEVLGKTVTFDLPKRIVEAEVHNHLANENRLEDDEHRAEVTDRANETLRTQILLDQLADDLEIEVEENELLDYLVNSSRQYGVDPTTFIQTVQRQGQIPQILAEVARSKAAAFALRRVKVTDSKGAVVDLSALVGTIEDEAKGDAPKKDAAPKKAAAAKKDAAPKKPAAAKKDAADEADAEPAAKPAAKKAPAKKKAADAE